MKVLVGNQFVWIPCTIDGANNTIKYDRYAYSRDGWTYRQTKLDVKDTDGSYKIQRADQSKIYYYHEAMIKAEIESIEKYEGFYIGRYEVGCDTPRSLSNKGDITATARIKENLSVYNFVTRDEARIIAEKMYSAKSRLCSSYAWDTVLKFIDGEAGTYAVDTEGDNCGTGILESTGYNAIKNIYDIGGNISEWTTETLNATDAPCVPRRRQL